MTILCGIDSALRKSGAAILDGSRFVHAEAFAAKGDSHGEIFHAYRQWLRAFLVGNGVEYVALEEPLRSDLTRTVVDTESQGEAFTRRAPKKKVPITNMQTLLGLYGVRAHTVELCHALNIEIIEVNNQDWRQVIHGRRQAPKGTKDSSAWWKQQAMQRCQQLGWAVPSKDAGEAALIAEWLRIHLRLGTLSRPGELFAQAS